MDLSLFLAKVLGVYIVVTGLAVLLRHKEVRSMAADFEKNTPVIVTSGAVIMMFGLVAVVAHNVWVWDWRVLVTIVAWLTLLKGAIRLYVPVRAFAFQKWVSSGWHTLAVVAFILVGICLIYHGFELNLL